MQQGQQTLTPSKMRFCTILEIFLTVASYIMLVTYLTNFKGRRRILPMLSKAALLAQKTSSNITFDLGIKLGKNF